MSWAIRRTLLVGVGAWGRAVLAELRGRWERVAPLLDDLSVERLRSRVVWALVEPSAAVRGDAEVREFAVYAWPPLEPVSGWLPVWRPPPADVLAEPVRYPAAAAGSRRSFARAVFLERRVQVERNLAAALDALFEQVRHAAGGEGELAMPLVCVVGALREPLASVALWPLLSLMRGYLATRQLPEATTIAMLNTAEPDSAGADERRRAAACVYQSLRELEAIWRQGRSGDDAIALWLQDPAWRARLAEWPSSYTYLVGREDTGGGLLRDAALTAAAASALDLLARPGVQEAIDEGLGALRREQLAVAPFSSLGAASRAVPIADLVAARAAELRQRLIDAEVLPELDGADIADLWCQADTFFRAYLSPSSLFGRLAAPWVGGAAWSPDDAAPPTVERFGPDIEPCALEGVPLEDVIAHLYRWRDRARVVVHPAVLDELPAGAYRDWLAEQTGRTGEELDGYWRTRLTELRDRWHEEALRALDDRVAELIADRQDLRGLRRAECFLARLLDRVDDIAARAPLAVERPVIWSQAAEPLAERLRRNVDGAPLPAAIAGRVVLLLGVLVGLLWSALPAMLGPMALTGPRGALIFWLLVTVAAVLAPAAWHAHMEWFIGRRCRQLAALAEADVRQWIVYVLWPWATWPHREHRASEEHERLATEGPRPGERPSLRWAVSARLVRVVLTLECLAALARQRQPGAPAGDAQPVRELVCPPALAEALAAAADELHGALARAGLFAPLAPVIRTALGAAGEAKTHRGEDGSANALARRLWQELDEASYRRLGEALRAGRMPPAVSFDGRLAPVLEELAARARPLVRFWAEALPERDLVVEQHIVGLADRETQRYIAALDWARATHVPTGNPLEACWMRTLHGLTAVDTVAAAIGREQASSLSAEERRGVALSVTAEGADG